MKSDPVILWNFLITEKMMVDDMLQAIDTFQTCFAKGETGLFKKQFFQAPKFCWKSCRGYIYGQLCC